MRDAGNMKALERLEVIRNLNANGEWVNSSLYKLMRNGDMLIVAYERLKSQPGNMTPGSVPGTLGDESETIEMHHVRHIRKMSGQKARGFLKIMAILNRKQLPVCRACHRKIHAGGYDGLKLEDLAYDPTKPEELRGARQQARSPANSDSTST